MRRLNLISLVSIISLALGVGVWVGNNPTQYVRLSPEQLPETSRFGLSLNSGWRSGVHLVHNGWFIWRDAPYGDLFSGAEVLIPASIAWIGGVFFVWLTSKTGSHRTAAGWMLGGVSATAFIIGRDPMVWSWIAGVMILSVVFVSGGIKPVIASAISSDRFFAVIQIFLCLISAALSLQFFPLAIIVALLFSSGERGRPVSLAIKIALISLFVGTTTLLPSPPNLDYPPHSRVVAWDVAPNLAPPLVGPASPIQYIDFTGLQAHLTLPILVLAAVAILLSCSVLSRRLSLVALLFCLLVGIDSSSRRIIQESSPLLALGRLLPYHSMYPISWLLTAIIPFLLSIAALKAHRRSAHLLWVFGIAVIAIVSGGTYSPVSFSFLNLSIDRQLPHAAYTPSRLVAQQSERQLISTLRHRTATSRALSDFRAELSASHHPETVKRLVSETNPTIRWTPGGGAQTGTEWIAIRLADPHPLVGVELNSGDFIFDFARGIDVLGSSHCTTEWLAAPLQAQMQTIVSIPRWLGPIQITPSGLPYYGTLAQMPLFFGEKLELQCLLLRQKGTASNDWSVTKLRLLTIDEPVDSKNSF